MSTRLKRTIHNFLELSAPGDTLGRMFDYFMMSLIVANAIAIVRTMVGATRPHEAAPGTIRGDFALETAQNLIHASDGAETAAAELALWKIASIDVAGADKGAWYKEIGQGMGAALNTASASNAYVLTDRGTWLSFRNRGDLDIVVEDDNKLFNQYGVILVNPAKHPHVKKELGQQFIDWLISAEGQKAIADYKINGQQLFFPNATVPGA